MTLTRPRDGITRVSRLRGFSSGSSATALFSRFLHLRLDYTLSQQPISDTFQALERTLSESAGAGVYPSNRFRRAKFSSPLDIRQWSIWSRCQSFCSSRFWMNVTIPPFSNASLLPESQATQIVREALRGGVSTPKPITHEEPAEVYVDDNLTSSDIKSTPHYHYHGLAVSQSQSQFGGRGGDDSQGSQETSHSSITGPGPTVVTLDHLAPPLSPKSPYNANEPPGTPSRSKAGKSVSFTSPQHPPVTPLRKSRSLHAPARRSPSPESQDSFAGSISVNPEEAFLAKSKRFGLPLSQLENSPEVSEKYK